MKRRDTEDLAAVLRAFIADRTIQSLVRSAEAGQERKLQRRTARVFDRFAQRIALARKAGGNADAALVAEADSIRQIIKTAFQSGQFRRSKSKRKTRREAPPTVFAGGLPGLGKRR
jgi:hypothetical protein